MPRTKKNIILIENTNIYEKVDDFATRVCAIGNALVLAQMPGMLFEAAEQIFTELRNVKFVVIYKDQFIVSYITKIDDKLVWCTIPNDLIAFQSQGALLRYKDLISRDNVFDLTGEYNARGEDINLFAKYVQHTKTCVSSGVEILDIASTCCVFGIFAKCVYDYAFNNMKDSDVLRIKNNGFSIDLQPTKNCAILTGRYKIKQ